ncbi:unnamed protein product [Adineta ricciae]|uniref:Uncharacterized protein n=1 Tax=Adineta ricciae TaxID=249248 RepID=A0A814IEM9_ADIRI|nr:unnamed protein product [Adineta ricciae]
MASNLVDKKKVCPIRHYIYPQKEKRVKQTNAYKIYFTWIRYHSYKDHSSNDNLLVCYAIISCLLVGIHLLALLMSMCILPELKSVIRQSDMWINNENSKPLSSLNIYIEIAWVVSTGLGLFLFIIELGIIIWIKVSGFSRLAAISALVTLCLVGCPFILFAIGFYFRVTRAKVHLHQTDLEKIEQGAIARGLLLNNPVVTPTTTVEFHIDENH